MLPFFQDIRLIKFIRNYYTLKENYHKPHWHNYYQLLYVRKGSGCLQVEDTVYRVTSGDAVIILPNENHSFASEERMDTYEVKFLIPKIIEQTLLHQQIRCCHDASGDIKRELQYIEGSSCHMDSFGPDLIILSLMKILVLMQKEGAETRHAPLEAEQLKPDQLLDQVNTYIDANMHRTFHVKEMARDFYTEYTHFSRSFCAKYGVHLQQYIKQRRVDRVKELLTNTNTSVTKIASMCGFANLTTMERSFKALEGMSPRRYRLIYQSKKIVAFEEALDIIHYNPKPVQNGHPGSRESLDDAEPE